VTEKSVFKLNCHISGLFLAVPGGRVMSGESRFSRSFWVIIWKEAAIKNH
jgi:hypothetical protein